MSQISQILLIFFAKSSLGYHGRERNQNRSKYVFLCILIITNIIMIMNTYSIMNVCIYLCREVDIREHMPSSRSSS